MSSLPLRAMVISLVFHWYPQCTQHSIACMLLVFIAPNKLRWFSRVLLYCMQCFSFSLFFPALYLFSLMIERFSSSPLASMFFNSFLTHVRSPSLYILRSLKDDCASSHWLCWKESQKSHAPSVVLSGPTLWYSPVNESHALENSPFTSLKTSSVSLVSYFHQ